MIKVVYVITGLGVGGAEMMLVKLLTFIDRKKFQPIVISLTTRGEFGDQIESMGIPVYDINLKKNLFIPYKFIKFLKIIKEISPDIIQGWMYHGNLVSSLASIFLGNKIPVIWNIRGSHYQLKDEKKNTAVAIWLGGKLSHLPKKIINNSLFSAIKHEEFLGYKVDKREVIPNGFDTNKFSPSMDEKYYLNTILNSTDKNVINVGLIGRYHPMKDHKNFIRAAEIYFDKYNIKTKFIMIGRDVDNQNEELFNYINQLNLKGELFLLGERSDIDKILCSLDIVVSSSYSEGFPNVIGEAMASGVPCVVTDVGDSAWIVGKTGKVVPPRDSENLAEAIYELSSSKIQRESLGQLARERVIQVFSIEKVVEQYEKLYLDSLH